jgi:hypothetical protein
LGGIQPLVNRHLLAIRNDHTAGYTRDFARGSNPKGQISLRFQRERRNRTYFMAARQRNCNLIPVPIVAES